MLIFGRELEHERARGEVVELLDLVGVYIRLLETSMDLDRLR